VGEVIAVIGGSGCGKSTLLRLVSGLDAATEGRIVLDGAEVTGPHPAVGVVFQDRACRRGFRWRTMSASGLPASR
jgi:sulfonate transport system ATP-binding protein